MSVYLGSTRVSTSGKDGYTPQKGIDYLTEEDKAEIINEIFEQVVNGNEVQY